MHVFLPQLLSAEGSGLYPRHPHPQLWKKKKIKLQKTFKGRNSSLECVRYISASPAHSFKPL